MTFELWDASGALIAPVYCRPLSFEWQITPHHPTDELSTILSLQARFEKGIGPSVSEIINEITENPDAERCE